MESAAQALLRRLGSGVRPGRPAPARNAGGLDGASFEDLVAMARAGRIDSGRGLDVSNSLMDTIDAPTMERLSAVADAAEAAGFVRVGALVEEETDDGRTVRVFSIDARDRLIESVSDDEGGRLISGVDAFVRVPEISGHTLRGMLADEAGRARRDLPGAPLAGIGGVRNASMLRALEPEDPAGPARPLR